MGCWFNGLLRITETEKYKPDVKKKINAIMFVFCHLL